jgi:hypothetical protein
LSHTVNRDGNPCSTWNGRWFPMSPVIITYLTRHHQNII